MSKSTGALLTTAVIGAAAMGTAAYMAKSSSKTFKTQTRKLKKNTGRALRQASEFIDGISGMMG